MHAQRFALPAVLNLRRGNDPPDRNWSICLRALPVHFVFFNVLDRLGARHVLGRNHGAAFGPLRKGCR
jgi:hypothetical protein